MKCAVVAQARGEEYIVNQWIAYNLMLGFDRIILFDHLSDPPLSNIVDKAFENQVVLKKVSKDVIVQRKVYDYAVRHLCNGIDWIAFIDLDEFIVLKNHNNIKDFLNKFPNDTGCILLHWECFTSQGFKYNPDGYIFDNYIESIDYKAPQNLTFKSISRRKAVVQHAQSVHIPEIDIQNYKIKFPDFSEPDQEFYKNHVQRFAYGPAKRERWENARIYHFMILSDDQVQKKLDVQKNTNIKEAPTKYTSEWIAKSYPKQNLHVNEFAKHHLSPLLKEFMKICTGIPLGGLAEDITEHLFSKKLTQQASKKRLPLHKKNDHKPEFKFPFSYPASIHEVKLKEYFGDTGLQLDEETLPDIKKENYIICFSNRCGSNLLCELLSMDGQIRKATEGFNYQSVIERCDKYGLKRFQDYVLWLMNRTSSPRNIFGSKLGWGQLYFLTKIGVIPKLITSPKFIHIHRKDVIGQAIALSIAYQTKQWSSQQEAAIDFSEVKFNPQQIVRLMDEIQQSHARFTNYFQIFGIDYIDVTYEQLVNDQIEITTNIISSLNFAQLKKISINLNNLKHKRQASELNEKFRYRLLQEYRLPIP